MAQSGYTPIQLYYSTTASAAPTAGNLNNGELAINITDGKLFYKDNLGAVQTLVNKNTTGTVTSVAMTVPSFLSVSGSPVTTSGTFALSLSGTALPVSSGGTGATSLTANNVLLGNGTSALQVVAPGTSGNVLTSNGTTWTSAVLPAGGLTYVVKTSNYTTQDKEGVLANTTGGAFTVTLPASPSTGAQVVVADAAGTWGTNNLTIGRNGSTIAGVAQDLVCDITGVSVQLVYSGTTWDIYCQVGGNGGTAVTLDGVQTLTNKTMSGSSNTFTNISLTTAVTGTLPVANGGTGVTTSTGSGSVVLNSTPALTNPTVTNYVETPYSANSSTAITIDLANGTFQIITLTGNATITMPTAVSGKSFIMLLKQDATGSRTVTWSTVAWPGGTAPTVTSTASKQDIYSFYSDGSKWYGTTVGQNYTY